MPRNNSNGFFGHSVRRGTYAVRRLLRTKVVDVDLMNIHGAACGGVSLPFHDIWVCVTRIRAREAAC
jgi:hypothetical protein